MTTRQIARIAVLGALLSGWVASALGASQAPAPPPAGPERHRRAGEAVAYIAMAELQGLAPDVRSKYLRHALSQFDFFFESLKNPTAGAPSKQVLAHIHGLQAYALKRLDRYEDALVAVNSAIDADDSIPELVFNAACYAALMRERQLTLAYIAKAIQMRPSLRGDAVTEDDLRDYWDDIRGL